MKKIMYLHGLESSNVCDKVDFLKERAEVLAPSIDYRKSNIEEELMYMVESFKPDLIIGSSMGGHVGLMLANYYKIEAIVFNPAIHSRPLKILELIFNHWLFWVLKMMLLILLNQKIYLNKLSFIVISKE